ncbi:alpha/beta hydrolase [Nonlabens sp. Hel1_33_55]|uniref:alpha/beta hydrolase n=1 Tax=Nonlabens sp. Hel1_33_55 TaxID=1336802 RepID=UPI001E39C5D8|nr:alpha/beta hydrolase [Nonlabens sp. Hel1_33_55]
MEMDLWQNGIPNSKEHADYKEIPIMEDGQLVKTSQVTNPTLSIYKPEVANGTAVLILPGGGYKHLSMHKEGTNIAQWLNSLGITAVVLKYRLPSDAIMENRTIAPLQDAQEAMRTIRRQAADWGIESKKLGVIGFSAGGHLASTLSTHYMDEVYKLTDNQSCKPDFAMLIYPVITMKEEFTHQGSKSNLIGDDPKESLVKSYSNEDQINKETPPTILIHALDDKSVPYENSVMYFDALQENNVPSEIHLYQKGGHGFGLDENGPSSNWPEACEQWLRTNSFID